MASELGVQFIEASAKAGINIKALFKTLASSLPDNNDNAAESQNPVTLKNDEKKKLNEEEGAAAKKGKC